jgi:hypothetical protein
LRSGRRASISLGDGEVVERERRLALAAAAREHPQRQRLGRQLVALAAEGDQVGARQPGVLALWQVDAVDAEAAALQEGLGEDAALAEGLGLADDVVGEGEGGGGEAGVLEGLDAGDAEAQGVDGGADLGVAGRRDVGLERGEVGAALERGEGRRRRRGGRRGGPRRGRRRS